MSLFETLMTRVLSIVYGVVVLFHIAKSIVRNGFSKTFKTDKFEKPECLADPKHGVHGFLHLEDVRIHYVANGPEDKPLMLFLHGYPEFWFSWRHQMEEFKKDYRVVAYDMRGYGESDKPAGVRSYTVDKIVNDVKQVIHALGHDTCVLVAHDWGGAIAWAFARLHPEMCEKLIVLNCPPSPVMNKLLKNNKEQFKMSWYFFFYQLPWLPELAMTLNNFGIFNKMFGVTDNDGGDDMLKVKKTARKEMSLEELNAYKYTYSQPGARSPPIHYYRAAIGGKEGRVTYDMGFTMPVLLVWGMKDFALHHTIPDLVQEACSKVHVVRLPDAGHFVQTDDPEGVNTAMRDWLGGAAQ